MANSADPDQLASWEKPTDLDLHSLYPGSAGQVLTIDLDKNGYQVNIFLISPQKHVMATH